MSSMDIRLAGGGDCEIVHHESGVSITSSKAPEYGGRGDGFSATDLLAAALGSCIGSNIEPVALRHDVPLDAVHLTVDKRLCRSPKRIESLKVTIDLRAPVSADVLTRLKRAADQCVVHRSLSSDVSVELHWRQTGQ